MLLTLTVHVFYQITNRSLFQLVQESLKLRDKLVLKLDSLLLLFILLLLLFFTVTALLVQCTVLLVPLQPLHL